MLSSRSYDPQIVVSDATDERQLSTLRRGKIEPCSSCHRLVDQNARSKQGIEAIAANLPPILSIQFDSCDERDNNPSRSDQRQVVLAMTTGTCEIREHCRICDDEFDCLFSGHADFERIPKMYSSKSSISSSVRQTAEASSA